MKKIKQYYIFILVSAVLLCGCSKAETGNTVSKEEYDKVVQERDEYKRQLEEYTSAQEEVEGESNEAESEYSYSAEFELNGHKISFTTDNVPLKEEDKEGRNEDGSYYHYYQTDTGDLIYFEYTPSKFVREWIQKPENGESGFWKYNGIWYVSTIGLYTNGNDLQPLIDSGELQTIEDEIYHEYVLDEVTIGDWTGHYYKSTDLAGYVQFKNYYLWNSEGDLLKIQTEKLSELIVE